MTYQALARKWRPKCFADLVGQEHVVRALSNALKEARVHHAYLLTGTRGVGKTTIARILAKSLNCERGMSAEPCGKCSACQQIDTGRFVDLLEIDAASHTGIDNMRELLENAQYSPTVGRYKVYIIDEVHMLSKSAFNAMLKTLEEPPAHAKFVLATTDPQKIPVTVLSRCLQFSLRNMAPQQIAGYLAVMLAQEAVPFEMAALSLLGRAAAGSMRDAISLLDQAIAYGGGEIREEDTRTMLGAVDRRYLYTILEALAAADGPRLIAEANELTNRHLSFDSVLAEMATLLHQMALAQIIPDAIAPDEPERDVLFSLLARMAADDIQLYYQIVLYGRKDLALAPDEHAGFIMTLLRMLAFQPIQAAIDQPPLVSMPCRSSISQAAAVPIRGDHVTPKSVIENGTQPRLPSDSASQTLSISGVSKNEPTGTAALLPEGPPVTSSLPSRLFDGDWPGLVDRLAGSMGAARMLALNAVLKVWTVDRFELAISGRFRHLAAAGYQQKLKEAVADYFGRQVELVITIEELSVETPAAIAARCRQEKHLVAQTSLASDPVVQQFVHEFNATLLVDTVQPV